MEIEKPSVTLIVTVYNYESYLSDCFDSIARQTYDNLKVILVDDGSTDQSCNICREYCDKYDIFHLIRKANGGVSSARNKGMEAAETDLIGFVDCDDVIGKHYVERLVDAYCTNHAQLVTCGYSIVSEDCKLIKKYKPSFALLDGYNEITKYMDELIDKKFILSPCSKLFSREMLVRNVIRFDEGLYKGEDLVFNLDVLQNISRICGCPYEGYYYKMHEKGSLSRSTDMRMIGNASVLLKKGYWFCRKAGILEKAMYLFSKYYFKSLLFYLEGLLKTGYDESRILIDSKKILYMQSTKMALRYRKVSDTELMIYCLVFSSRSSRALMNFVKTRMWVKKHIRGY